MEEEKRSQLLAGWKKAIGSERKGEDAPAVRLIAAGLLVNCREATGEYACCKVKVTAFA